MKSLRKAVMGAAVLVLLTGCSSMKKVDYATFEEKAKEAIELRSDCPYTKAVVKGTLKAAGQEIKLDSTLKVENAVAMAETADQMYAAMIANEGVELMLSGEAENTTYYVGGGFKVEAKDGDNKGTVTFDKYGLLTSYKVSGEVEANVTVKWSK